MAGHGRELDPARAPHTVMVGPACAQGSFAGLGLRTACCVSVRMSLRACAGCTYAGWELIHETHFRMVIIHLPFHIYCGSRAHIHAVVFRRLYSGGCIHAVDSGGCIQAVVFTRLTCADARNVHTHGHLTSLARHTPQKCLLSSVLHDMRLRMVIILLSHAILHENVSCPLSSTKCAYSTSPRNENRHF